MEAGCITDFAKHGNVSQLVSAAVTKYSHIVNIPSLAKWGVATRDQLQNYSCKGISNFTSHRKKGIACLVINNAAIMWIVDIEDFKFKEKWAGPKHTSESAHYHTGSMRAIYGTAATDVTPIYT